MAEAVEVEIPSTQRYFCHLCARRVSVAHPDLTCRICQSGFVEELSDSDRDFLEGFSIDPPPDHDSIASDESDTELEGISPLLEGGLTDLIRRTIRRTILDFEVNRDGDERGNPFRIALPSDYEGQATIVGLESRRPSIEERIILPFVTEVYGNLGGSLGLHDFFQLASNLGDYAFGSEWDAIITQILNETEQSGPPPLSKEKIDELPLISVDKEHVSKSLQCTVCMEDFILGEKVKCLPCEHIFHPKCIVPWLEMHATCPICRKQISS